MADPAPHFFKHFTIAVHPDDLAGVLRKCTLPQRIADAGGRLMFWEDGQKENYTHVIARNSQKPLAVWARDNGKTVVSLLWVWDCLGAGRLLPLEAEQLYSLDFRIPPAHSTQEITITATGYSGIQRHIYLQMLETAGMKVVKEMHPFETTHILAADVHDKSSGKIKRALLPDVVDKIRIVNVLWLYDCLRQGCILPTGGYERNPPEGMDPAKGALAIDARMQTVAASDSSEGSPSQPEEPAGPPASRSAVAQVPEIASAADAPGQRHGEARDQQDTSAATAIDLEQRRRAVPSVNGFQPLHLEKQQAPRSAAAQQNVNHPGGDPIEECSPQELPGNGWRQRKSLKPGSGRSARPLADIANSSPAVPGVALRKPGAATGAAMPTASKISVPSEAAGRGSTPTHAAQAQPRMQAAQHRVQQPGPTPQAQLDPKRRPAAQQRTQEPEPPAELGAAGNPGKVAGPGAEAGPLQQGQPGTDANRLPAHSSPELAGAHERAEAARKRPSAAAAGCIPSREDLRCSQPDSCANMSEQVAGAEAAVAVLVDQVGPSESAAGLGADDETDSELDATVADSGKCRQQRAATADGGSMQAVQDAAAGKAQPLSSKQQPSAGAKGNKRLCAAIEEQSALPAWIANRGPEQQRPEQVEHAAQADRRIPVNLDAPLASQVDGEMQEEGTLEAADARGPRLQASQGHKGAPQDGVLWRAQPIKRAARSMEAPGGGRQKPGRGEKRASAAPNQDPLIGRRLRKAFQDRSYEGRVECRDADAGYFRIVYEDNDSEEMSFAQLEPLLLPDGDDGDAESPPAAAETPAVAEQSRATAAAVLPPPEAGEGAAKGRAARKGSKRQAVADAPGRDAAEHADKRRKSSRAAARPAAAEQPRGRGRQPALGDANGQLPSAGKRRTEEAPERAGQAGKRRRVENDHNGAKRTKAIATEAPSKRISGKGATPVAQEARPVKRRPVFAVSSMHTDERNETADALRSLKVGVSLDLHSHQWEARITHLLLPGDWVRGAKVLAAMAAGSWLLSTDYLAACTKNHALLEEEDYEIATNCKNTVSRGSPRHWRLRRTLHGQAAFQGLKVVVHGEFEEGLRPRRDEVVSILQAGGANLLTLHQGLSLGVHFVVTKASRPKTDAKVKQLQGAGLCIVAPAFVVDWIAHPWTNPSKHTLHGSRMGSDLTAAAKARGELQA